MKPALGRARKEQKTAAGAAAAWQPSPVLGAILLTLAGIVFYGNTMAGGFVMDDTVIIQGNDAIRSLGPDNLLQIFGSHYWKAVESRGGLYRPLVMLTYACNYAVGGEGPEGYHLVNVFLHAFNGVLVFFIVERLSGQRLLSWMSALLFLLHPIRTEAVASVVGRAELLSASLALSSWHLYVRARLGSRPAPLVFSALLYGAACLAKESSFSFVGLLPVTDYLLARRGQGSQFSATAALARYLPFVLAAGLILGLRYRVLGGFTPLRINPASNPMAFADPWTRFLTATHVFARYVWLLVYPVHLSFDYSFNQIPLVTSLVSLRGMVPIVLLLVLFAGTLLPVRRHPLLFLAGSIFWITFALTANWIRPIGTIMAERLMYLPALGFNLAVAFALALAADRPRWRKAAMCAALFLALAYGARAWDRNFDWRDHYSLFRSGVVTSPDSALVQANYAVVLLQEKNDAAGAQIHARRALEIQPDDPAAWFTLGQACYVRGDLPQSAEALARVVTLAPRTSGAVEALRRLASIYEKMSKLEEAGGAYKMLLDWRPGDAEARDAVRRLGLQR